MAAVCGNVSKFAAKNEKIPTDEKIFRTADAGSCVACHIHFVLK